MSASPTRSRRQRVERGIYTRTAATGKTVFEIGWHDAEGRQRWRTVPGGIKAARAALAEAQTAKGRGERVGADPRLRFKEASDAWWEYRAANLKPATQATYKSALKRLLPAFGGRRMTDITATDVAAFIKRHGDAGLKAWTIRGHLTVLQSVFTYASRHMGYAGINPVALLDHVERPRTESDERPKRILSPDELQRLLESVDDRYRPLFELAAETGGRLSEVLGLTWGDVDLEQKTITFNAQLGRNGQRATLKTKRSRRCLEITDYLTARLREAKIAATDSGKHAFVFTSRRGTAHDQRNIGGRVLARAVERAGLGAVERDGQIVEYAPTFHSLRHSHASNLIAQRWDIEEVSARLGHANSGITSRTYVHAFDAANRSQDRRARLEALRHGQRNTRPTGAAVIGLKLVE